MSIYYFLILIFLSTHLYADTLETIEVRAEKELSVFNLGSSQSLNDLDLERKNTALLAPALSDLSAVVPSQNGGPGGRVSYFIRGTEARHVSFTIDNLRINDSSNTDRQFDSAFLSSAFLSELTLYKGPQAVLFGSDAMGGLVDMKTRKGEHSPETRLSLNGGSFGTLDSSLSQDWKSSSHEGTLTWSSMRTDGISRLNKKRFDATERDAADMTQLTSSSRHHFAQKWQTDFLASFLRGNNELDGASDDNSHDESRNDQYMVQQKTTHSLNDSSALSLRNGLSRHQRMIKTFTVPLDQYEGDLIQNELLYNFEKEQWTFLSGLSSEQEIFEQQNLDKKAELYSLFLQTAWKKNGLHIQAGIRAEKHSRFGDFQTGAVGIGQTIKAETFSLQYSQGFKAPSLYQLNALPLFGFPIGNSDLVPERNHAYEARWVHDEEVLKTEVSFFQNRLSNLITFSNAGYRNQGHFIAQGVEISLDRRWKQLRARPGFLYQEFKDEETVVLRRPTRHMSLEVAYFPTDTLEVYSKIKNFNSRKDVDENGNNVKLNGHETVDLGSRISVGHDEYGVQFMNIFDRDYEELYGYSVMPRSVFMHYGHKF